jgi:hypothetical protein
VAGGHISDVALAHAPPTGFLAVPLQPTARPGECLPIEQATARPHNAVGVVTAGTGNQFASRQGMKAGRTICPDRWLRW